MAVSALYPFMRVKPKARAIKAASSFADKYFVP